MADFNSHIITNAGRNLLARALAGEGKVLFTKAAFGDQKHSGNLREVTELKNKKLDLNVMNIRNDNGTAVLTVQISNQNVDQSFQTEEFGVYAKIEGDATEILYSYTTAVSADTFPNNRLGKTYESIQDIYMAISSDVEAEIYVRDGVIYLTRDIANQVYTETGLIPVGELKGRSNLEANKQYLAGNGHWYKNVGGDRTWNGNDSPDENFIPITWEELSKQIVKSNSSIKNEIVEAEERVIGKSYGGILNEAGQKYEGKTYYDKNTKKLFLCKRNNTDISANINNYIAMDSNSLLERLENLFKYSKIFEGRAATKGQVLGSIPDNSKFLEIIGINYADDNNFYYFQPITLRTEIIRNRDIFFNLGITSDMREFGLSFKNNVITIIHSATANSTADNNVIGQILSVNS